jgi:preprotein translocase subunit SecA
MSARTLVARLPVPGPACGAYPQRAAIDPSTGPVTAAVDAAERWFARWGSSNARRAFAAQVRHAAAGWAPVGSSDFFQQREALRAQLGLQGFTEPLVADAFALAARVSEATLGVTPFDTQVIAGRILLDSKLAEMATGEGKTLSAMLAAATAALAGVPVHVVTANPYLAARDAEQLAASYRALGLSVAAIRPADDEATRRVAYASDIVYCTASDLIFDYLRDHTREAGTAPLLRGLCMAIIDEADSVLIDEARTPFVLAHEQPDAAAAARHRSALALARGLQPGTHYRLDPLARKAHLEPLGQQLCADAAAAFGTEDPLWKNRRFRSETIEMALAALHLYRRDLHYLLRPLVGADGQPDPDLQEVAIIDATTGRIAAGRRWSNGLHQLIELKEGVAPSKLQSTRAQLTYQRFFPRYWRLAGMSGTLREAGRELQQVYGLAVETVPLRLPSRRRHDVPQIFASAEARWSAVTAEVVAQQALGRPVLVGTDSVTDAHVLSERLAALGIAHQRLDARQDADEAACIARAGAAGCVTVATNMAGRGTDILLGASVAERGGLHVVACQQNPSVRTDRQLHGRAARAGDPGSVSTLLSLDEGLLAERLPAWCRSALARLAPGNSALPRVLTRPLLTWLQSREAGRARRERSSLLRFDRDMVRSLGFGGLAE